MSFGSRLGGFGSSALGGANTSGLGANTSTMTATMQDLANDLVVPNIGDDSVSDLSFSPQAEFLSLSNWDKSVRIYEVTNAGQVEPRAMYNHDGPVLSTRFTMDGTKVISGGADKQIKLFDMASQQNQTVGVHQDGVRFVRHASCGPQNTPCIVSGSWDKTVKYWDTRQQSPICSLQMPDKVYAMDTSQKLLVVGTADRNVVIINLNNPDKIFKTSMSPLKYQTRSISCYPSGDGFAIGSIEGRCGLQYVDDMQQKERGFSFKCQRETKPNKETHIYALNSIVFHPGFGTFVTSGSDGTFSVWDKEARNRIKSFPGLGSPISTVGFNRNGSLFAYAMSYDWSKGYEFNTPNTTNQVRIHVCKEEEFKPKPKKR